MSRHRFTMQELDEMSDMQIIEILVNERYNDVTNPYTPFAERLKKISGRIGRKEITDMIMEDENYEIKSYTLERQAGYKAPEMRLLAKSLSLHPDHAKEIHDAQIIIRFYKSKDQKK